MGLVKYLVVMVKAPRLGQVKRRLAAEIGDHAAWRVYRQCTAQALARLAPDPRWRCLLAVTPDRFAREGRFWPRGLPRLPQGPGDLGARMARLLTLPEPGPVVIVGSDIPDLRAGHVAAAFRALGSDDVVFGPAQDGGYWLVGARRRPPVPTLFRDVRWSTEHALEDTLANLPPARTAALVETLCDIDTAADLAGFRSYPTEPKNRLGSSVRSPRRLPL